MPRRVRFTATAQRHVTHEKSWWLENRLHKEVFATEFEEGLRVLSLLPGAEVTVRAVWGARRRVGPTIKP